MIDAAPAWRYTPALAEKIELKWQKRWEEEGCFFAANKEGELTDGNGHLAGERKPYTVLDMFPFPSGKGLHVGHPLGYIATDFVSRFKRMQGYNVLHALGFDAFGLPAEQFAITTGQHPRKTTEENIANMRRQLSRMGLSFDTRRSFATTDPEYMKWTQWIFSRLYSSYYDPNFLRPDGKKGCARPIKDLIKEFESGKRKLEKPWNDMGEKEKSEVLNSFRLAYISDSFVNWCPGLGTVLANEEVTKEGKSERGNWPVYRKKLRQWSMRITAYADRLLEDLGDLNWPETVKAMQKNWIGKCDGIRATVEVSGKKEDVFLLSARLLFSPSFLVFPSSFPLSFPKVWPKEAKEEWKEGARSPEALVSAFKASHPYPLAHSMDGIFSGLFAKVGAESVPVFISDYVSEPHLGIEGEEDAKFARLHSIDEISTSAFASEREALEAAERKGLGKGERRYRIRDWLFSRQRYWGEPFPIVYSEDGVEHLLPDTLLPVTLPPLPNYKPESFDPEDSSALPTAPLARNKEWMEVELDLGDGLKKYKRETNTMPNWAGSCWYYLRYLSPDDDEHFVNPSEDRYFLSPFHNGEANELGGVDLYVGGVEHAVLHLLYARFWHKVLYDLGYLSSKEPFYRLFNQGYVQAYAYTDSRGQYVPASQVESKFENGKEAFYFEGEKVNREFGKMGKSLKNMVTPDEMYANYGADTFRVYEMSMGPLAESRPWNLKDLAGSQRFLQRLWRNVVDEESGQALPFAEEMDQQTGKLLNKTIEGVSADMEEMRPNIAISKLIVLNNRLTSLPLRPRAAVEGMIKMLFPIAPHICEELWEKLGHSSSLSFVPWPKAEKWKEEAAVAVVQVDGKVRCRLSVPPDIDSKDLENFALSQQAVKQWLGGEEPVKVICRPPKIISLVSKSGRKGK